MWLILKLFLTDVNECQMGLHNCSLKDGEVCVNMPGTFMCRLSPKCPQGYQYNNITLKCEGNIWTDQAGSFLTFE